VSRSKTCKHWQKTRGSPAVFDHSCSELVQIGYEVKHKAMVLRDYGDAATLDTAPDFGCVIWEGDEPEEQDELGPACSPEEANRRIRLAQDGLAEMTGKLEPRHWGAKLRRAIKHASPHCELDAVLAVVDEMEEQ
jgi:hypothetical protein